jgi:hypothetical protein
MKQFYQLIFLFFVTSLSGVTQDVLYFMNYDTLLSKVISIKPNEIEYKKFNNLNGPSYFVNIEKINKIVFKNGSTDEFNYLQPRVDYDGENAVLVLVSGDRIDVILFNVDANNIRYKKKDNLIGPDYYSSMDKIHKIEYSNGEEDIFNKLKAQKSPKKKKALSNAIRTDRNNYYLGDYRISAKKVENKLEALHDADVTKLLNEARQVNTFANTLGYSSIGFAIIGTGIAFAGLFARAVNGDNEVLVVSGWTGVMTLATLIGSGSLRPVYKDRMKRAIALYNQKLEQ